MRALFDLQFSEFVTTGLIKVLYILLMLGCGLGLVFAEIAGLIAVFDDKVAEGLGMMFFAPFAAALYLVLGRMWMELVIVIFRIAENVQKIADRE